MHSESVGPYLRHMRKGARLTLAEVAEISHYSATYISKIERGVLPAPFDTAARITRAITRGVDDRSVATDLSERSA